MHGQKTFLFLEFEDTLFDGVGDGEFVDDYVDGLSETVDTVDGLFFDELGGAFVSMMLVIEEKYSGNSQDSKTAQ